LAGTPPALNTTSFRGFPDISTTRPPTWKDPMSRKVIGSPAIAGLNAATVPAQIKIVNSLSRIVSLPDDED
jgi:hypothetical protein